MTHESATAPKLTRAIGLMSGTSLDGIDVALLDTDGATAIAQGPARVYPYEAAFRRRMATGLDTAKAIDERCQRPGDLLALEHDLTVRHGAAVERFLVDFSIDRQSVDLVGFHGQTVLHRPEKALTVQIGDGDMLARHLGIPVVFDMRAADMVRAGRARRWSLPTTRR